MQIPAVAKKKKKTQFILGFYLSEISAGRDCKMLYILSVAKRQLLPESFWLHLIMRCLSKKIINKKEKNCTDFTSHAEHTSASVGSLRRNPDIHAPHPASPHPPSPVSTAGFILSAETMTGGEKGVLSPLAGQHWNNIHVNETFFMSPGIKWHFYDAKNAGKQNVALFTCADEDKRDTWFATRTFN